MLEYSQYKNYKNNNKKATINSWVYQNRDLPGWGFYKVAELFVALLLYAEMFNNLSSLAHVADIVGWYKPPCITVHACCY